MLLQVCAYLFIGGVMYATVNKMQKAKGVGLVKAVTATVFLLPLLVVSLSVVACLFLGFLVTTNLLDVFLAPTELDE